MFGHRRIVDSIVGHPVAKGAKGEWQMTVRDPWATNASVEGGHVAGPTITVPPRTLAATGGLNGFLVGPAR